MILKDCKKSLPEKNQFLGKIKPKSLKCQYMEIPFPQQSNVNKSCKSRLRPYHPERAGSRLISEAKQGRAWLVLGWELQILLNKYR